MAEIKNTFLKSKMNKDLDSRLIPNGEYRDAQNVNISRSEDSDVGSVENVLGNVLVKDWLGSLNCPGIDVIGHAVDLANDRVFFFLTNYTDNSIDNLSNFAPKEAFEPGVGGRKLYDGACCWIAYYNVVSQQGEIIVSGNFLNFSKTHPVQADVLEDLLFFTDDRNQPRKINVNTAISNPETYYTNEDHISVTKFAPMDAPNLYYQNGAGNYVSSMVNKTEEYLPISALGMVNQNPIPGAVVVTLTEPIDNYVLINETIGINLMKPDLGYFKIKNFVSPNDKIEIEYPIGFTGTAAASIANYDAAALAAGYKSQDTSPAPFTSVGQGFTIGDVIGFQLQNPNYDAAWSGDKKFIEDKFLRFSYRFKYDDGEYSVMAPFTQPAFIPKQWGHLVNGYNWLYGGDGQSAPVDQRWALWKRNIWNGDEDDIGKSGIVSFMENQVNEINLNIPMPYSYNNTNNRIFSKQLGSLFKVQSIEILSKESDKLAIKVVDEIPISQLNSISSNDNFYNYNYKSIKPIRALPTNQSTRVYDKSPIKSKTQAITGNRVVYGNYIDKATPPDSLNYEVKIVPKPNIPSSTQLPQTRLEYPNHTLKQNRTYQVGVVLSDRYGRSSSVLLRDKSLNTTSSFFTDTIYHSYNGGGLDTLDWPGDNLQVQFNDVIPESISSKPDYPGLFSISNPTGWYSYKLVVKQTEQEYYNVYLAGATSGDIIWTGDTGIIPGTTNPKVSAEPFFLKNGVVSNISLYNDNINKVPKALVDVGATDTIYGSNTLLYPRVITDNLLPAEYLPPQSIGAASAVNLPISIQAPSGLFESEVTSIRPFRDLGEWTTKKGVTGNASLDPTAVGYGERWYPNNEGGTFATGGNGAVFIDPFYKADDNPFIATITTDFTIGAGKALQERYATNFFSNQLTIFETNPVKSNLDIFWETSTTGLISDLNTEILNGLPSNTVAGVSDIDFEFFESDPANTMITAKFEPVDANNNACVDPAQNISNFNVINGVGANVTSLFEIKQDLSGTSGTPAFWVENTATVPYLYDSNSRNWTFSFDVTANGSTVNIQFRGYLSNIAPSVSYNAVQWWNQSITTGQDGGAYLLRTLSFSNYITDSIPSPIGDDFSNQAIVEINPDSFLNGSLLNPQAEIVVELDSILDLAGSPISLSDWPENRRPIMYAPGTFSGGNDYIGTTPGAQAISKYNWVLAWPSVFQKQQNPSSIPESTYFQFVLKISDCNNNKPNNVGGLSTTTEGTTLPVWGILF